MPYIKLKQRTGEYVWGDRKYRAGVIEEVTEKEAFYLVHQARVAEPILQEEKERVDKQAEINKRFEDELSDKIKVAMVRLGGLGDTLLLACHAKAVKRK